MKIKISKKNFNRLKTLGGPKWATVKGETPLKPEKVLSHLIDDEWEKAFPEIQNFDDR